MFVTVVLSLSRMLESRGSFKISWVHTNTQNQLYQDLWEWDPGTTIFESSPDDSKHWLLECLVHSDSAAHCGYLVKWMS